MAKDFGGTGGRQPPRDGAATTASPEVTPESVAAGIPEFPRARGTDREAVASPLDAAGGFRTAGQVADDGRADLRDDVRQKPQGVDNEDAGRFRVAGLALPTSVMAISPHRRLWFAISFLAPVILGALYLFLIAPDQYVTEYRFSVRVPVGQPGSLASGGASLSALFGGNPTPGTDLLDNYTVADYASSEQAAADLDSRLHLRDMFSKPFDPFSRISGSASMEKLAQFWSSKVYSDYDASSGLVVVRVKAFSPQDSYSIATTLLGLSSDLVNTIGNNSQQDSVRYARSQVDKATADIARLRGQMADLRRNTGIVSPNDGSQDIVSGNESMLNTFIARDSQIKGQIALLTAQLHNPNAPQIGLLRAQLAANAQQIADARKQVSTGSNALAGTVGRFEDLQAQLANATNVLSTANNNYAMAQAGADAQRLYLTAYVKPRLPETPLEPNRWYDLLIVVAISGMVWIVGRLVGNSIMEHS